MKKAIYLLTLVLFSIPLQAEPFLEVYLSDNSISVGQATTAYLSTNINPKDIQMVVYRVEKKAGGAKDPITRLPAQSADGLGSDVLVARIDGFQASLESLPADAYANGADYPARITYKARPQSGTGYFEIRFFDKANNTWINGWTSLWVNPAVRGSSADVLIVDNEFTRLAYSNYANGYSAYAYPTPALSPLTGGEMAPMLSRLKPGDEAASSGAWAGNLSIAGRSVTSLIRFLNSHEIPFETANQRDIELDPTIYDNYDVVIIVGHHEYCTMKEVDATEKFIFQDGGHFISLSGNTCWWQVRWYEDTQQMAIFKGSQLIEDPIRTTCDPATARWGCDAVRDDTLLATNFHSIPGNEKPLTAIFGTNWENGGWSGVKPTGATDANSFPNASGYGGYWVQQEDHFIFAGTGLQNSTPLGTEAAGDFDTTDTNSIFGRVAGSTSIMSHEVDGVLYTVDGNNRPQVDYSSITTAGQPPAGMEIIAWAPAYGSHIGSTVADHRTAKATMVYFTAPSGGGTMLNTSTTRYTDQLRSSGGSARSPIVGKTILNALVEYGISFTSSIDSDGDLIPDYQDNCVMVSNFNQTDTAPADGTGDACPY